MALAKIIICPKGHHQGILSNPRVKTRGNSINTNIIIKEIYSKGLLPISRNRGIYIYEGKKKVANRRRFY